MQRQRPTAVTVCAILNIVFSVMGLAGFVIGGLMLVVAVNIIQSIPELRELQGMFDAFWEIPGYVPFVITSSVLSFIILVGLLCSGLGLLKMKPWARRFSIFYAVYTICSTLAGTAYAILVVNPAMVEWQQTHMNVRGQNPFLGSPLVSDLGAVAGAIFPLVYPIVLLVIMLRPGIAAAFRAPAESADADVMDVELAEPDGTGRQGEFRR